MAKQQTAIFDINKPFPKKFGEVSKLLIKFQKPYSIYLHSTLEPYPLLMKETDFLGRFKRCMFDGRVAPLLEVREILVPEEIMTCIDISTRQTTFLDFNNNQEFFVEGSYLEYINFRHIDLKKWQKNTSHQIVDDSIFAQEILESYKLENLYNTKLMKIYNSSYFDGMNLSADRIDSESLELFIPQMESF